VSKPSTVSLASAARPSDSLSMLSTTIISPSKTMRSSSGCSTDVSDFFSVSTETFLGSVFEFEEEGWMDALIKILRFTIKI